MSRLARTMAREIARAADAGRRQANMVRTGRVVEVDPANGRVMIDLGDEVNPLLTPWLQWSERAGARRTWNPPTVGEVMTVLSSSGEISEASIAMPGGFTDANGAPSSDGDAFAFSLGDVSVAVTAADATFTAGGVTMVLSAAGLAITGGQVTHNGTDIGDTHKHIEVQPGPAESGPPA